MRQTLTRISTFFSLFFRVAKDREDHQKLTRHIVAINRQQSISDIINEAAVCLKDMLSYRLFAFVVRKEKSVDIWLDPRMYKKSLEEVVVADFQIRDKNDLNYLNHTFHPDEPQPSFDMADLVYYEFHEEEFTSRIYMLPQKTPVPRHDEVVNMILQSCANALLRQVKMEALKDAAVIDPLTGCYNRREFETQLKRSTASAVRYNNDLSVFLFDLDHFKQINDTYGHQAGDKVLQDVVALVQKKMRTGDILARYGGEEFVAILPETKKVKAMELADRLRREIAKHPVIFENERINVTASFGVADLKRNADMSRIIQDADAMLYKAKVNGRNTVMPGLIKVLAGKDKAHLVQ